MYQYDLRDMQDEAFQKLKSEEQLAKEQVRPPPRLLFSRTLAQNLPSRPYHSVEACHGVCTFWHTVISQRYALPEFALCHERFWK